MVDINLNKHWLKINGLSPQIKGKNNQNELRKIIQPCEVIREHTLNIKAQQSWNERIK